MCSSLSYVEDTILQQKSFYNPFVPFLGCSLNLRCCVADGDEAPSSFSVLWPVLDSLVVSVYYKKKLVWWEIRTTLICGSKNRYLECSWKLCWLDKVAIVGNSLGSRVSPITGSWLHFQYQMLLGSIYAFWGFWWIGWGWTGLRWPFSPCEALAWRFP